MRGRQGPYYKSRWADKDPFITQDGQTKDLNITHEG